MSEEISLKDLMPNEFYINDIGLMCCELSLKEINRITDVLTNLKQENQQLKEMQCTYLGTGCKERRKLLESVLDEIREVLDNQMDYREFVDMINKIEEILDKVKNNE